jgi:uncharacterized lipoprotein YajG
MRVVCRGGGGYMRDLLCILSVVAGLSACQFVRQPPIAVTPELVEKRTTIGVGQSLRITVTDERTDKILGQRAMRGMGSDLTVANDITETLKASLVEGLRREAFVPVDAPPRDGRALNVGIRDIRYTVSGGIVAFLITTQCSLKAQCVVGGSTPYERVYRGVHEMSVQSPDTASANVQYVNAAVSSAVNQLLDDTELSHCLASPAP